MSTSPSPALLLAACLLGGMPCGCKRKPAPAAPASASARLVTSALPQPVEPSRCQRRFGLTLEGDAPPPADGPPHTHARGSPHLGSEDEDDDALLPFGVDVGEAVATTGGFAVAGVRGAGQAFVAVLGEQASRRVELGELHGDIEPPALAAQGDALLVGLRSSDAAGFTIKLGQIGAAGVEWGQELSKLGKAVYGLELATSGGRGLLVYQGEDKGSSRLFAGAFGVSDLKTTFELKLLEGKDVETPRLVARSGGFWLTWVRSLPEPKKAAAAKPKVDTATEEDPEERELLELSLRVVEVAKLDELGKPQGAVLRVGEPRRQVILFDVAPLASGGLLVATRSDSATPGVEGGALVLNEVGPDGSVHEERLDDDEIGAGAPVLLVDGTRSGEPWLAVSSPSDATRLGLARGQRTLLWADPLLGRADVIAVSAGHFLTQRARGQSVELWALACQLGREAPGGKK